MSAASLRDQLSQLPHAAVAQLLAGLDADQLLSVEHDWSLWARPEQLPPLGDWTTWLICAGRGWGKTRTLCEWILSEVRRGRRRIAIVARTAADCRDVLVEGPAGILACAHPRERPEYLPSVRRLVFPSGAIASTFSAEEGDALRGPQHDAAVCDELAAWPKAAEVWDMLQLGLRLGERPRCVIATTPRPTALLRSLMAAPSTVITKGATWDNAQNLAASALAGYRERYSGTRLGRQELEGEVIEDMPGALWGRELLDRTRVKAAPDLVRIVVSLDPAITAHEKSDSTGIVVAGRAEDGHLFVLQDASLKASPDTWARRAIALYDAHRADAIIGEVNQGGDLIETVLRQHRPEINFRGVHASRGKQARAEPISALFEQGKAHIVGCMPELEAQLCEWVPGAGASPDRLDAMVWALSELSAALPGAGLLAWMRERHEARAAEVQPIGAGVTHTTRTGWTYQP